MSKKSRALILALPGVAILLTVVWYFHRHTIAVLQPAGQIAQKERNLIIFALLLSVLVVVPVFTMAITIAWKYRENNHKTKKYSPDWDHSRLFESIWWGVPLVIILVLSVVTWRSSHALDPYKTLASTNKPITIQVVALNWKWLFIYPEQNIASVNQVQFPVNTPVNFDITSDTVMNSFWVPSLGGQIYAMPGMMTQLHLMADKAGSYRGSSANISGVGFAGMTFVAKAGSSSDFNNWVQSVKQGSQPLNQSTYKQLAKPSENNSVVYYSSEQPGLFDTTIMKYMEPTQ